jgi:hypothetical protein
MTTVKHVIPTRFGAESAKLALPITRKPVRDIGHQLVAVHHTLSESRKTANWQGVHHALQDLEMMLMEMGETV